MLGERIHTHTIETSGTESEMWIKLFSAYQKARKRATSFIKEDFCMHGVVRNVKLSIDFRKLFLYLTLCEWIEIERKQASEQATNVSIYVYVVLLEPSTLHRFSNALKLIIQLA